jgi:NAD(P)H-dependent FMN reductase
MSNVPETSPPSSSDLRIGVILASTRQGRRGEGYAKWIQEILGRRAGVALELLDLREHRLPAYEHAEMPPAIEQKYADGGARLWSEKIHALDGYVIVTPEYNHGYPAPLKSLIDSVGAEWHAKPVAFVSYGGISGGLRAVEQLRQVFAELHTVTIRDAVSFAGAWEQFDEAGKLLQPDRHRHSMATLLARLHWWAVALRNARRTEPYTRAA